MRTAAAAVKFNDARDIPAATLNRFVNATLYPHP